MRPHASRRIAAGSPPSPVPPPDLRVSARVRALISGECAVRIQHA